MFEKLIHYLESGTDDVHGYVSELKEAEAEIERLREERDAMITCKFGHKLTEQDWGEKCPYCRIKELEEENKCLKEKECTSATCEVFAENQRLSNLLRDMIYFAEIKGVVTGVMLPINETEGRFVVTSHRDTILNAQKALEGKP